VIKNVVGVDVCPGIDQLSIKEEIINVLGEGVLR